MQGCVRRVGHAGSVGCGYVGSMWGDGYVGQCAVLMEWVAVCRVHCNWSVVWKDGPCRACASGGPVAGLVSDCSVHDWLNADVLRCNIVMPHQNRRPHLLSVLMHLSHLRERAQTVCGSGRPAACDLSSVKATHGAG